MKQKCKALTKKGKPCPSSVWPTATDGCCFAHSMCDAAVKLRTQTGKTGAMVAELNRGVPNERRQERMKAAADGLPFTLAKPVANVPKDIELDTAAGRKAHRLWLLRSMYTGELDPKSVETALKLLDAHAKDADATGGDADANLLLDIREHFRKVKVVK